VTPQEKTTLIIEDCGGTHALATLLHVPESIVSSWRSRGEIPRRHHAAIVRAGLATEERLRGDV